MSIVTASLKKHLLTRVVSEVGFPRGTSILRHSIALRREMWQRKAFPLKEAKTAFREEYEWRY